MAKMNFQMDPKKADLDKDGKLSDYEKTRGEAVQRAVAEGELPEMAHGGMACGCDHDDGLMADPMAMGTTTFEMADDIPVMLSKNEYVLPAHVVKWRGLKHIMDMQTDASDAALCYTELYKFAFVYASIRLGQSGQGLSNKDFVKALEIVAADKGGTFIENLKSQTKEIVQIFDTKIADLKEGAAVRNFEFLDQRDLLSGYKQTNEEFATSRGFGGAYAYVMAETQPPSPKQSPSL